MLPLLLLPALLLPLTLILTNCSLKRRKQDKRGKKILDKYGEHSGTSEYDRMIDAPRVVDAPNVDLGRQKSTYDGPSQKDVVTQSSQSPTDKVVSNVVVARDPNESKGKSEAEVSIMPHSVPELVSKEKEATTDQDYGIGGLDDEFSLPPVVVPIPSKTKSKNSDAISPSPRSTRSQDRSNASEYSMISDDTVTSVHTVLGVKHEATVIKEEKGEKTAEMTKSIDKPKATETSDSKMASAVSAPISTADKTQTSVQKSDNTPKSIVKKTKSPKPKPIKVN